MRAQALPKTVAAVIAEEGREDARLARLARAAETDGGYDSARRYDEAKFDALESTSQRLGVLLRAYSGRRYKPGARPGEAGEYVETREYARMHTALARVSRAAEGDSNDGEIAALQQALDMALDRWPGMGRWA